jgi:hypothetical protein
VALQSERLNYNVALQHTSDAQVLLNLVRLQYRDTPIFLEISGITSRLQLETSATAGADLEVNGANATLFTLGGGIKYTTEPIVTYTPLQGEDFVQRLLAPMRLEIVGLLYRSGWTLKRVLRLCVQRLNAVENAPRASGPTPERAPAYQDFARVVDLMRVLEERRSLELTYESGPTSERPPQRVLHIAAQAWVSPEMQELADRLRLVKGKKQYPLTYATTVREVTESYEELVVETRSLLGILFFLSQGVEVPWRDREVGKVMTTSDETGQPFDWQQVVGDLFVVKSLPSQPSQAAVAIRYRGSWFSIADTDLESKATFALVTQLLALQSGKVQGVVPMLTLPLGK